MQRDFRRMQRPTDKSLRNSVVCSAIPPKSPPRAGFLITHFESIEIRYENPQIAYHRA